MTTTILRKAIATPLATTLCLSLLLLMQSLSVFADDARIETRNDEKSSFTITKDKGGIEFNLYLLESDGDESYWKDDPEIWLDGVKICTLSELGIPVLKNKDVGRLRHELENVRSYEKVMKSKKYNDFITIASYDPRYYKETEEYWVTIGITLGYNVEGGSHRVEVRGNWADNHNKQYSGRKVLGFDTEKYSTSDFPASAGAATRQNGKVVWSATGLKQDKDYQYIFSLQKNNSHVKSFEDNDIGIWGSWTAELNSTEFTSSFEADNYKSYIIYPRVITKNATKDAEWFDGDIKSSFTFRKDYKAVTVKGFPRAEDVQANTTNAYNKKVKITWEADVYDKDNVDTKGRWYIFRRKIDSNSAYTIVGDVAYSTHSFTDSDMGKEYYEPSNKEYTQYEYVVCFVPNGWTVETPEDAKGLYASTKYQLNRTFTISDLKVKETTTGVTLDWAISSIEDASSSNAYTLFIERSDDNANWQTLSEEKITSSTKAAGSYTDSKDLKMYENHFYRVSINVQDRDYHSSSVSAGLAGGTTVTEFTATRGVYSNSVKMQWNVEQVGTDPTYFELSRRPLGSNNVDDWKSIHVTNGTASFYSYEDNAIGSGSYYQYHLQIWLYRDGKKLGIRDYYTDGFGLSTGVLSGRIYYDSGTSVEGVKISLRPSEANGESLSQFRSIRIQDAPGAGIRYMASKGTLKKLMDKNYTVQMYLSPDSTVMTGDKNYTLFEAQGSPALSLKYDNGAYALYWGTEATTLRLPAGRWSHLTMVKGNNVQKFYLNGLDSVQTFSINATATKNVEDTDTALVLGNNATLDAAAHFAGYVDEFRLFSTALTEAQISQNYSHTLSGTEEGLSVYWPMDENISAQTLVYDYSKTGDVANTRTGLLPIPSESSSYVPTEEQLSLSAYTDKDGNFMVRGIPFSGEGTNYIATPTLGIHKFNPSSISCYVSNNSLVFSGQNFTDVSSFPVSGRVRYADTTIPVEGVTICIDGVPASKDGEFVKTDKEGNYTVDVPIGDHYITVAMQGHEFTNGGRYPADPDNTKLRKTFESAFSNVDFFDETTVVVAGRVSGGKTENAKPLGVNASVANIGKATITLDFKDDPNRAEYIHAKRVENETSFYYEQDSTRRDFTTVQGYSRAYVPQDKNYIQIETDSITGEFAVKLPPLRYTSTSVQIVSQPDITFENTVIDATNVLTEYTDSTTNEFGEDLSFTYNASAKFNYRSPSVLDIKERDNGAYGASSIKVTDINGKSEKIPTYTVKEDGTIDYRFGYPVYESFVEYEYEVNAYERYVNKDGEKDVEYIDPLADIPVTIKNQYAGSTSVRLDDGSVVDVQGDSFKLDSLGHAVYTFTAGLPNIQKPYTRTLAASYEIDGQMIEKPEHIEAVILGALTTGNNFTTQGPDEVMMILRDPPGSRSRTVYTAGTDFTRKKTNTFTFSENVNSMNTVLAGLSIGHLVLTGPNIGQIAQNSAALDIILGVDYKWTTTDTDTRTETVSISQQVSTGATSEYVGNVGDVFIGSGKNIIFGESHNVIVKKDEKTGNYVLTMEDGYATAEEFTTGFNYTAWHVEHKVIPDFIDLRNALLKQVGSIDGVARPAAGQDPIYVTTLDKTDKNYGLSNDDPKWGKDAVSITETKDGIYRGPSYTMILPADYAEHSYQDMVKFYNEQVTLWQEQLANNERAKVTAIENREEYFDQNYSFDNGTAITNTLTNKKVRDYSYSSSHSLGAIIGFHKTLATAGIGVDLKIVSTTADVWTDTESTTEGETVTTSYTLQDDQLGDNLSVDVFNAPDGFGPIFYTRAGSTTNPYEDEVVTKYYQPGTVIAQKTLQVEKPELEILDPVVTGVPAGSDATFRVKLRNNSETQRTINYGLTVAPANNTDGAQVWMDGRNVNNGITIAVPYGEMTKTLILRQSNPDVMDYKNILLRFFSTSQPNDLGTYPGIYSDGTVTVQFQPACSNIALAASTSVVNTQNVADLKLDISGYDYSMASLQGVRLEYKGANDADFRTLQEYRKDTAEVKANKNLLVLPALTGGSKLTYTLNLSDRSFTDQTYVFRAVTICNQGGNIVNSESDEVEVVRDLSIPQLISTPTPASGILGPGDDISITFNEDIASSSLTLDGNFTVTGQLNNRPVVHETALALENGAKAKTDATINLIGQSFSADMWLNYSQDGRILYHGARDNGLAVDIKDGRLALTFDNDTISAQETLPKDKWVYLHVNYDRTGVTPMVSAAYAQDDKTVRLINQTPITKYQGCNGPLTLGGTTLVGKVQELAFWNTPRTMEEAQATMYTTKNVFTDALIGYWPLDEGHGLVASDKARSRNLTLPAQNAWWISAENFAAILDGNTALKANIASSTTTSSESYLLEGWFRADMEQKDSIQTILSVGDTLLAVGLNKNGQLTLSAYGEQKTIATANLHDASWHHLAFNVLKDTKGSATVYLDGNPVRQLTASAMPALQSDALIIGGHRYRDDSGTHYDQFLTGAIDEIRIWKGRRTAEVIRETMYSRVRPDADGLAAYYPLEATSIDANNQVVTSSSAKDATGKATTDMEAVTGNNGVSAQMAFSSESTPALTARKTLENVAFSFVASERTVKVNLGEDASRLEGCTVNITAKNIRDLHGNSMQPTTWSVYVNQSRLKWGSNNLNIRKDSQETAKSTVTINNIGGETEKYSIIGIPSWLNIDRPDGSLKPLAEQELTFSINPGLAIGNYETTIWLTGNQGIELPLHLNVKVEGQRPDWSAEEGEYVMNVIGQLNVDGIISADTSDLVAAFMNNRCVGVASPEYYDRFDAYIVMLNVYGSGSELNGDITYKAYDASTGRIYPIVDVNKTEATKFKPDTWVAIFKDPVIFTPTDKVQQTISRDKAGWNWVSLYVKPEDNSPKTIFSDVANSISLVNDYTKSTKYDNGMWIGDLTAMNNSTMYKVDAKEAYKTYVDGVSVDPATVPVTIKSGWNWIGYPVADVNNLDAAFADADPQEGDIVKSQLRFAMYTEGQWVGRLTSVTPGAGYIYYSQAKDTKTFHYPKVVRPNSMAKRRTAHYNNVEEYPSAGYENNMTMLAVVRDGETDILHSTVEVYAGTELRGRSEADENGLHFITIGGSNAAELLTFVVTDGNTTKMMKGQVQFKSDAHYGSMKEPYVLQLSGTTGIDDVTAEGEIKSSALYTTTGALVMKSDNRIISQSDLANLKSGVYIQRITYADGTVQTIKMTKK